MGILPIFQRKDLLDNFVWQQERWDEQTGLFTPMYWTISQTFSAAANLWTKIMCKQKEIKANKTKEENLIKTINMNMQAPVYGLAMGALRDSGSVRCLFKGWPIHSFSLIITFSTFVKWDALGNIQQIVYTLVNKYSKAPRLRNHL